MEDLWYIFWTYTLDICPEHIPFVYILNILDICPEHIPVAHIPWTHPRAIYPEHIPVAHIPWKYTLGLYAMNTYAWHIPWINTLKILSEIYLEHTTWKYVLNIYSEHTLRTYKSISKVVTFTFNGLFVCSNRKFITSNLWFNKLLNNCLSLKNLKGNSFNSIFTEIKVITQKLLLEDGKTQKPGRTC